MERQEESKSKNEYGINRVSALTDGVFAIAATLLVIDLTVPSLSYGATSADLWNALAGEYQTFLAYLLSFFILGVWWTAHHRHYRYIRKTNSTLLWLNLLLLLWIGLLPFFTKILSQYGPMQTSIALYALDQGAAGLCVMLSWYYASRNHRLIDPNLPEETIKFTLNRSATAPIVFFISIAISFVYPFGAYLSWIILLPAVILVTLWSRRAKKKLLKAQER
jgi:uncharacterized membrane protein